MYDCERRPDRWRGDDRWRGENRLRGDDPWRGENRWRSDNRGRDDRWRGEERWPEERGVVEERRSGARRLRRLYTLDDSGRPRSGFVCGNSLFFFFYTTVKNYIRA